MSAGTTHPLAFSAPPDDREEVARAEVYGLLAQLFYAPPGEALYAQLQVAPTEAPARGALLEASFSGLVAASRRLALAEVKDEYATLFLGIGKPEVFLYGSHHLAGALNERPLVELRDALVALGLARAETMEETEDHVAYLCEVMRWLIAGDEAVPFVQQRRFCDAPLRGWVGRAFDAIDAHPAADFYRAVAAFARDFFAVEGQAFDMLEA